MEKSNIQKGLEIFTLAYGAWGLESEHDLIWVSLNASFAEQEKEEADAAKRLEPFVAQLEELGWMYEDGMGWSHYT